MPAETERRGGEGRGREERGEEGRGGEERGEEGRGGEERVRRGKEGGEERGGDVHQTGREGKEIEGEQSSL